MPARRSLCQDISRSSSPGRGIRRSLVICSLPSLIPRPLYPVQPLGLEKGHFVLFVTVWILPAEWFAFPVREKAPAKVGRYDGTALHFHSERNILCLLSHLRVGEI